MNQKRINFYQGHICVKNEDGRLSFVSDECIPKIKQRIDIFIKENPKQFNSKAIIFGVLSSYFKISKSFITPNHTSVTPLDDSLYTELLFYISSNPLYSERLQKCSELKRKRYAASLKNKKDDIIVWSYEKEKRQRLKKIVRKAKE